MKNISDQFRQANANLGWIPNLLTALRIVGALVLIFLPTMGIAFYVLYVLCGLTDTLDGALARKLNTASSFGAKLDSAADLSFYAVMLLKLLPKLRERLPDWIWYLVALALVIRIASYLVSAIRFKKFASLHNIANKMTGAGVFGVGIAMYTNWLTPYATLVTALALFSSTWELIYHLR